MGEMMEQAVLRMPPELWSGDIVDVKQRHFRYIAAADALLRLRSVNASLVDALKAVAMGVIVPPMMSEQARQMMSWQDAARAALSRAEQLRQETCVWRYEGEGEYQTTCGRFDMSGSSYRFCPFCGKWIEQGKKADRRQG